MQRGHIVTFDVGVYLLNVVSGVRHKTITCDACEETGLRGIRWKCTVCDEYDLCHVCYMFDKHELSHAFIRYDTPISVGYTNASITSAAKHHFKT